MTPISLRLPLAMASRSHWTLLLLVMACVTVAGIVLAMRKRWAWASKMTDHPFTVYVVLSVVAHLVLALWAYTARLFDAPASLGPRIVTVELGDGPIDVPDQESRPWDQPPAAIPLQEVSPLSAAVEETPAEVEKPLVAASAPSEVADVTEPLAFQESAPEPPPSMNTPPTPAADLLQGDGPPGVVPQPPDVTPMTASAAAAAAMVLSPAPAPPSPTVADPPTSLPGAEAFVHDRDDSMNTLSASPKSAAEAAGLQPGPLTSGANSRALSPITAAWNPGNGVPVHRASVALRADGQPVPHAYRDRLDPDRVAILMQRGGGSDTEAGVHAALTWLAASQSRDGRWDSSQFGGGQAAQNAEHERDHAGIQADTGVTGLAILAFLGAGHTHLEGSYRDQVRRGIDFLIQAQRQRTDGSLAGDAGVFAAMYCHGIATLALSECYAITGDVRLLDPVRRAIAFSLSAQHPTTGGWRYRPYESGDMSQLGWQLMAVTSGHYGGLSIPPTTWAGIHRFLNSVSWGHQGGLASYRPGERPSTPMTAEALLCRLYLGLSPEHPLVAEAADFILADPPRAGRPNYYYWYYATLALYQLQDSRWDRWNEAIKDALLSRQKTSGDLAGSWDTDSVWGGSGGRVYTTALAALTLEVYYRYQPLHQALQARRPEQTAWRTRPQ